MSNNVRMEKDFCMWAENQSIFLKKGEFEKLDIENLAGEIEDLSKRERDKLTSYIEILLIHRLKMKYQIEKHTRSWELSIKESLYRINKCLEQNPSLQPKLKEILNEAYYTACIKAERETGLEEKTFPKECPFPINEIFINAKEKYLQ